MASRAKNLKKISFLFGNILSRYVMRTVFLSTLLIAGILSGLYIIFTFIAELGDVGHGTYTLLSALEYVLLGLPNNLYLIMPIAGLLGALVGLGLLASHSELLIMRAAGLSISKISIGVGIAGFLLALLTFVFGAFLGPWLQREGAFLKQSAEQGQSFSWSSSTLWLKDGHSFIYIGQIDSDGMLENVVKYDLNLNNTALLQVVRAPKALYQKDHWILFQPEITTESQTKITQKTLDFINWQSTASPALLSLIASSAENLTLPGLIHFIRYQIQNGLDSSAYELKLWRLVFQPVSVLILMLIALPFVFGPARSKALGWQFGFGLGFGLIFFFIDRFFGAFSEVYHLSPFIGASLPCLIMLIVLIMGSIKLN